MRQLEPTKNGYEEGLAAGKKVAGSWTPGGTTLLAKWKKTLLEAPQALLGGKDETELVRELDKWTREDQLACAADLHRRKLDAFPDVKRFPEIAGMDQYQEEYPKGYADEAGIDVREVYLGNYWRDLFFHVMKGGSLAGQGGACSEAFFPKTPHWADGGKRSGRHHELVYRRSLRDLLAAILPGTKPHQKPRRSGPRTRARATA